MNLKTTQRPILEVSNLRIQRGDATILDGISWRVQRGEHWVILGANGSGKTSLLSALAAYLTPTDGEQISRRYDSCAGSPQPVHLHLTILHVARNVFYSPLTVMGKIESTPALQMNCAPDPRYTQDRAPPATA